MNTEIQDQRKLCNQIIKQRNIIKCTRQINQKGTDYTTVPAMKWGVRRGAWAFELGSCDRSGSRMSAKSSSSKVDMLAPSESELNSWPEMKAMGSRYGQERRKMSESPQIKYINDFMPTK